MNVISIGHTNFLVKMEIPWSSPKSSRRLATMTFELRKIWPALILIMPISMSSQKLLLPTMIELFSVS